MSAGLPENFEALRAPVFRDGYDTTAAVFEPITHYHEAAEAFRMNKGQLLDDLSKTSFEWRSIDLMIAVYNNEPYAVLLVSVSPDQVLDCKEFFDKSDTEELLGAKVYVVPGRPVRHGTLVPGASLSAQDHAGCQGTYGGPILLGGELYALTCHHVVFDQHRYPESRPVPCGELEKAVYSPSFRNYPAYLEHLKEILEAENEAAKTAAADASFENWRIGTVKYDSGGIPTVGWRGWRRTVDWTLVKLKEGLTAKAIFEAPIAAHRGAIQIAPIEFVAPDEDYTRISEVVGKSGISTGFTQGRINGVYSLVRMAETITEEMFVLPERAYFQFSSPGDSGAWVITESAVVGIVLGGSEEYPYRTYIADIRHVLQDIHRVTHLVPTIAVDTDREPPEALRTCVMIHHALFTSASPGMRIVRGPHLVDRGSILSLQHLNDKLKTIFGFTYSQFTAPAVQIGEVADDQFGLIPAAEWPHAIANHGINYVYVHLSKESYLLRGSRTPWPGGFTY
ncbi:hypothetical protein FN846DRAFT_949699 [Sphaerosporella brunnea]|uniref:Uncharacterized protein n=1 Tax=Sphaerosporella brunnea TaxID=1250544 RepID=A0A5J5EWU2_9PEZI|nr:hypothetical protein FN846DRAFT_949699 [Sphaerosporella brunnea]